VYKLFFLIFICKCVNEPITSINQSINQVFNQSINQSIDQRCRPQHTGYSGVAKVDVSEDPEPSLSKVDVILTFTLEVCHWSVDIDRLALSYLSQCSLCFNFFVYKWPNKFDERPHRMTCRHWRFNDPFCCVHRSRDGVFFNGLDNPQNCPFP